MVFIVFLRGVNVGGHSAISMAKLKESLTEAGYKNVTSYINSGNIVLSTSDSSPRQVESAVEKLLAKEFFAIDTIVISAAELAHIVAHAPASWSGNDVRKYVAFVKHPTTPKAVVDQIQLRADIDSVALDSGVVYMTTKMSGLTKSGFTKLIGKPIYKQLSLRNFNTVQKLYTLAKSIKE